MHILGMAKSSLCLKGAKASKLELDFFKLAFAVAKFQASGKEAVGDLQVLSVAARDRAAGWIDKYQIGDAVRILYAAPSEAELVVLSEEKARNAAAFLATPEAERAGFSLASIGRELGESALVRAVLSQHPGVVRIEDRQLFPQKIDWDFYGVLNMPGTSA